MAFKEITPYEIPGNIHDLVGNDWMLVTAGGVGSCNTMTASWGQAGILWNKPVVTVYIRPQRYTKEFVEREGRFSLAFFGKGNQRTALGLLGTKSGRDGDKIAEAGLHVQAFDGVAAFEEAELVLVCRKLYQQDLLEDCFLEKELVDKHYPSRDFHRAYVAEVERAYIKE